jgi:hypothetical protein
MRHTKLLFAAVAIALSAMTAIAQTPQSNSPSSTPSNDELYARIKPLEASLASGAATPAEQLELARLYNQSGRYYEASKIANRLLATSPNDAEAQAVRDASAKGMRDIRDRAVSEAEARAKSSAGTDADRLTLANAYFEAGSYAAAADVYAKLPASMRDREVRLREARALAWSSQTDKAERAYAAILQEQSTPDVQLEYGRVLSWMGSSRAAVETLNDIYTRTPTEDAAVALANARAWNGQRDDAIALLDQYTTAHPDAGQARQLAEQLRTSPELRLERLDKVIGLMPYNLALRVTRAQLLYDAGRYAEAQKEVDFVRAHATTQIADLDPLETRIRDRRNEELAKLEARRAALDAQSDAAMSSSSSSSNADELLSLAKAYSGLAAYDQSTRLYDRYLKIRPDDVDARIAYARVLSWDRRWNASQNQYRMLIDQQPDRADLKLEYAQTLSYAAEYSPSLHVFSGLTDISSNPRANLYSDVPARAHYNMGQIYRWFGWNDHAVAEQNAAITVDPTYSAAREELDLVRHVRPASTIDARYTYATDSNDFTLRRADLSAGKWISQRWEANVGVGRHEFEHFGESVSANVLNGGVAYRWSDQSTLRGSAGLDFYDHGLGTRPYFGVGATYLPNIQSRAAIDFNHYDLVYDVFTLTSLGTPGLSTEIDINDPISINDTRAHYDWNGGGFFSWLADGSYGFISDENRRAAAHGLATFRVIKAPFVAFKVDGRYLSYDFRTNRYWSPTDYKSIAGVAQIGQNIRDKFFWDFEVKAGRAYEGDRSSDIRSYEANVTIPISDAFDLVGNYGYGKSGRIDSVFAGSGSSQDFVNYWQRHFYVGVRVKQLFAGSDERVRNPYYYDNRALSGSPVLPPLGETH